MLNIVCFGEVLFDVFPTHTKIGGAPLNVALRLASLDVNATIISRIGRDDLGKKLVSFVEKNGVASATIQVDDLLKTGQVLVHLDQNGSATYDIEYPVSWDKIEFTEAAKSLVCDSDAFVFGSLVGRDFSSYQTLLKLISLSKFKIFDVNLRAPFYEKNKLIELILLSDFLKFNDDELFEICEMLGSPYHSLEQNIQFMAAYSNSTHICVTKGNHGAVLFIENQFFYNSGYKVKVQDTVGSGDSFLAAFLSELLVSSNPQSAINFACAVGAMVAQHEGANPKISVEEIKRFMQPE